MSKDYKALAADVDAHVADLFKAVPGPMRAFRGLIDEVSKGDAVDVKTKELMKLAIAIATHCEGCIVYHARAASKRGASREEVAETIAVAIEMGGGPSAVYGAEALAAFDQLAGG